MRAGLLLAAVAALAGPAVAETPLADTYVAAVAPMQSFGGARTLKIARSPHAIAYIRFAVTVPSGETVTRTTLRLFVSEASPGGFTVHRVPSTTWAERTTRYANRPAVQRLAVTAPGPLTANTYVSVDVTPLVTAAGALSLALVDASATPIAFASREAGTHAPRLLVQTAPAGPCGSLTGTPQGIDHVIWIWMENKSYDDVVGSPSAPYVNSLARACGVATDYRAVSHPSLPNYIAATSGSTQGIADDEPPSAHPLDVASIYSQLDAAGKTWADYAESAPGPCPLAASGNYTPRHDPAAYYLRVRSECASSDVPMGAVSGGRFASDLAKGTLPSFSFVIPDLCSDTHDCPVATGDAWLQSWFAKIFASPLYRAGRVVVFLAWDEDDLTASNHVPLVVVSPWTRSVQSAMPSDHYALLKATEQLLGLPPLGHAGDAATGSLASAFNLG